MRILFALVVLLGSLYIVIEMNKELDTELNVEHKSILSCFQNKNFYFVGTSYLRVQYFDLLELGLGRNLTAIEKFIPSYDGVFVQHDLSKCISSNIIDNKYCFLKSGVNCNLPGPAGVDMWRCGVPHNKTQYIEQYNITVHFQFKTYLSTPQHDAMIARELEQGGYDYLILGSANWGRNKFMKNMGYEYQANAFYNTVLPKFNKTKVFVYNQNYNNSTETQRRVLEKRKDVFIFNTNPYLIEGKRKKLRMGHGYTGRVSKNILGDLLYKMCHNFTR